LRVADVVAVLDALGIERAHFIGILLGRTTLCFGIGEHEAKRVRSLAIIGQQPYAIDTEGPLTRMVWRALADSGDRGIEALVEAFEAVAGRYPDDVRSVYLSCDGGGDAGGVGRRGEGGSRRNRSGGVGRAML
jgi:pimeloyl-ACP methyl ester carboxylesterase